MTQKYDIVSKGEIVSGFSCDLVKHAVEQLLKIKPDYASLICSGETILLKHGVELELAQKIQKVLLSNGLNVHLFACKKEEEVKVSQLVERTVVKSVTAGQSQALYNIISKGEIVSGFTCNFVKQNIEAMLKITKEKVDRICSGDAVTLQSNINLELAKKIQKALFDKGLKVYIVEKKTEKTPPKVAIQPVKSTPVPSQVASKGTETAAASSARKSTKTPELPKASNSIELSFSQDYTDLSEGKSVESEHDEYEKMIANAPVFELVSYEEPEGDKA